MFPPPPLPPNPCFAWNTLNYGRQLLCLLYETSTPSPALLYFCTVYISLSIRLVSLYMRSKYSCFPLRDVLGGVIVSQIMVGGLVFVLTVVYHTGVDSSSMYRSGALCGVEASLEFVAASFAQIVRAVDVCRRWSTPTCRGARIGLARIRHR